jgi:hypothetical protein
VSLPPFGLRPKGHITPTLGPKSNITAILPPGSVTSFNTTVQDAEPRRPDPANSSPRETRPESRAELIHITLTQPATSERVNATWHTDSASAQCVSLYISKRLFAHLYFISPLELRPDVLSPFPATQAAALPNRPAPRRSTRFSRATRSRSRTTSPIDMETIRVLPASMHHVGDATLGLRQPTRTTPPLERARTRSMPERTSPIDLDTIRVQPASTHRVREATPARRECSAIRPRRQRSQVRSWPEMDSITNLPSATVLPPTAPASMDYVQDVLSGRTQPFRPTIPRPSSWPSPPRPEPRPKQESKKRYQRSLPSKIESMPKTRQDTRAGCVRCRALKVCIIPIVSEE